jgi:hypothetical protein
MRVEEIADFLWQRLVIVLGKRKRAYQSDFSLINTELFEHIVDLSVDGDYSI